LISTEAPRSSLEQETALDWLLRAGSWPGAAKVLLVDQEQSVLSRIGTEHLPSRSAFALVKDLADDDSAAVAFDARPQDFRPSERSRK
jgi:streptomycin 6-kinase